MYLGSTYDLEVEACSALPSLCDIGQTAKESFVTSIAVASMPANSAPLETSTAFRGPVVTSRAKMQQNSRQRDVVNENSEREQRDLKDEVDSQQAYPTDAKEREKKRRQREKELGIERKVVKKKENHGRSLRRLW